MFTDKLLAVGEIVRQDLLLEGIGTKENFGLMPPGLALGRLPSKKEAQESFGLTNKRIHCAFIGRVTQIKRPDRFLDVVSEIKKRGIDLDFFIAGDGELMDACKERIIDEELPVALLGWQSDIECLLSAADIVIITSDNEGMPLSLIQAGMAGLPVIATNVGSVGEVVLDGITGIVTSTDVQEIADALQKLTGSAALRAHLGSEAQKYTLANFGVQRLVHDHEQLYKKLLLNRAKS
jgi:glycosyltransferase involved in cell wall biosynthesis